ncbi:MAG: LiaI-LiaF-like domain-containing protein [Fidelibacterota bacterium]
MGKDRTIIIGLILIVIGVILIFGNLGFFDIQKFWPLVIVASGLAFFYGYLADKRSYGFLMPGSIITIIGLLFLFCSLTTWAWMEYLWPVFILSPVPGFILMYIAGERKEGFLVPAVILSIIGVFFLLETFSLGTYWPVILIIAGIYLLIKSVLKG